MDRKNLKKLVSAMSIEEKALQLTQFPVYEWEGHASAVVTGMSNYGDIGCEDLWKCGTTLNAPDGETVLSVRRRRREKGIDDPFPFMLDVIHGYRTIYPVPLALACSFHTELVEDCACLAATEAKYDGVDITFSPMVDLVRDARWGRVMESGGEDPYWSGEVGKAMIRGYHRGGIACCVKHFAGYGAAEAGREYNTTDISERNLREYYLRSYRACLEEKPEMFMSSFNLLNGKPILGHKEIVVGILRREWGVRRCADLRFWGGRRDAHPRLLRHGKGVRPHGDRKRAGHRNEFAGLCSVPSRTCPRGDDTGGHGR